MNDVKEWLMRGWKIDGEINSLIYARDRAYERALGGAVGNGEKVQSSRGNVEEDLRISYMVFTEKINKRIKELNKINDEIYSAIGKVENSCLRTLLIERYINYKTWEQIGTALGYSYVHTVNRLHPKALNDMSEILQEEIGKE